MRKCRDWVTWSKEREKFKVVWENPEMQGFNILINRSIYCVLGCDTKQTNKWVGGVLICFFFRFLSNYIFKNLPAHVLLAHNILVTITLQFRKNQTSPQPISFFQSSLTDCLYIISLIYSIHAIIYFMACLTKIYNSIHSFNHSFTHSLNWPAYRTIFEYP